MRLKGNLLRIRPWPWFRVIEFVSTLSVRILPGPVPSGRAGE